MLLRVFSFTMHFNYRFQTPRFPSQVLAYSSQSPKALAGSPAGISPPGKHSQGLLWSGPSKNHGFHPYPFHCRQCPRPQRNYKTLKSSWCRQQKWKSSRNPHATGHGSHLTLSSCFQSGLVFVAFLHYRRRLCKDTQSNTPPGQRTPPVSRASCHGSTAWAIFPYTDGAWALPAAPEKHPGCSQCPTAPKPSTLLLPTLTNQGSSPVLRPAQAPARLPVVSPPGAVHACAERFHKSHSKNSSHRRASKTPQSHLIWGCEATMQTATPPCRQICRYRVDCSGVLQWKPGTGWQWVTRNH